MGAPIPENIKEVITAKLGDLGLELYELQFMPLGSRGTLRITIDGPDGVTVGDCERVSRELSLLLDVEEFQGGRPYTLEVSSPGIDRKLSTDRDFKRVVGRSVVLQMTPAYEGKKTLRVRVTGCEDGSLHAEVQGEKTELPLSMIVFGKEEIQF